MAERALPTFCFHSNLSLGPKNLTLWAMQLMPGSEPWQQGQMSRILIKAILFPLIIL